MTTDTRSTTEAMTTPSGTKISRVIDADGTVHVSLETPTNLIYTEEGATKALIISTDSTNFPLRSMLHNSPTLAEDLEALIKYHVIKVTCVTQKDQRARKEMLCALATSFIGADSFAEGVTKAEVAVQTLRNTFDVVEAFAHEQDWKKAPQA